MGRGLARLAIAAALLLVALIATLVLSLVHAWNSHGARLECPAPSTLADLDAVEVELERGWREPSRCVYRGADGSTIGDPLPPRVGPVDRLAPWPSLVATTSTVMAVWVAVLGALAWMWGSVRREERHRRPAGRRAGRGSP